MQTIYLDISNKGVIPCIQAKQSEVGRKFLAVITDNGVPYNIPVNSLLSVWYEGDTDAGNYSSIEEKSAFSIDGNKVAVELVAQMLLKPGNGELCLSITHGDGGETNTWNIPYEVEYKPGAGSAVPTEYYTALTNAAAEAARQVSLAAAQVELAKEQVKFAGDQVSLAMDEVSNAKSEVLLAKEQAELSKNAKEAAEDAAQEAVESLEELKNVVKNIDISAKVHLSVDVHGGGASLSDFFVTDWHYEYSPTQKIVFFMFGFYYKGQLTNGERLVLLHIEPIGGGTGLYLPKDISGMTYPITARRGDFSGEYYDGEIMIYAEKDINTNGVGQSMNFSGWYFCDGE